MRRKLTSIIVGGLVLASVSNAHSADYLPYGSGNTQIIGRFPSPVGNQRMTAGLQLWGSTPLHNAVAFHPDWSTFSFSVDCGMQITTNRLALLEAMIGLSRSTGQNGQTFGTGTLRFTTETEWVDAMAIISFNGSGKNEMGLNYLGRVFGHTRRSNHFMVIGGINLYGYMPIVSTFQQAQIDIAPRVGIITGIAFATEKAKGRNQAQLLFQGQMATAKNAPLEFTLSFRDDFEIFDTEKKNSTHQTPLADR